MGPWGHMAAAIPAPSSSRHPAPSGSERGRAGPGPLIPQSSLQVRLAGMCWARPSPGTTHPWEPCPALGAAVREWVHRGWPEHPAKLGTSAPPAPSTPATQSCIHKGQLISGGRRRQASLEQAHGPGALFLRPPYEGNPMLSLSSVRGPERVSALLEVTQLIRGTGGDPSSVCLAVMPLPFQGSPGPPPRPCQSEGRTNRVQNNQDPDKSPEGSSYCPWNPSP